MNLLINKLKLKQLCDLAKKKEEANEHDKVEDSNENHDLVEENYCKQNRWHSYDCTLCQVIVPSLGAFERHAQTELHQRALRDAKQPSM